jgi:hypothetical protein
MADAWMEGGCTCGAVRYALTDRPLFVHCCHCTWCRRETGSAFAVNALIETACIRLVRGEPASHALPSPSGSGQVFHRCPRCGLTLWSHYAAARERIGFVRVGTLDDPSAAPPDIHIYTSTRLPWVAVPEGVPAVADYYRRSEYWPPESVARYRAALE